MDTPQREVSVISASPSTDNVDLESLRKEYDNYRLKTKEWQNKVRDRDVKMRNQLQEATDMLSAKDAELEALNKTLLTLDAQRCQWVASEASVKALRDEVEQLRDITNRDASDMKALRGNLAEAEEELEQRNTEVKVLRARVSDLEGTVADAEWKLASGHILQTARGGAARDIRVHCRMAISGISYCYVLPAPETADGGAWVSEASIPKSVSMPRFLDEIYEERSRVAVADAIAEQKEALQKAFLHQKELEVTAMTQQHREALERAQQSANDSVDDIRGKLGSALSSLEERSHALEALRLVELPNAVAAAREEVSASLNERIRALQSKVDELETYKARAQVAMRHAAQSATVVVDASKMREQLEAEFSAKLSQAQSDSELQVASAVAKREEEMREVSKVALEKATNELLTRIQGLEGSLSVASRELDEVRAQLRCHEAARVQPITPATRHEVEVQTEALKVTPSVHKEAVADLSVRTTSVSSAAAVPPAPDRAEVTKESTSTFAFESMIQSLDRPRYPTAAPTTWEVDALRQQLQLQVHQLQKHREELREVALREKTLLEQDAVLKEQIREMERASARSKELIDRQDYLKNIVLKALTCDDTTIRRLLMPVVAEVLHLSPSERSTLLGPEK